MLFAISFFTKILAPAQRFMGILLLIIPVAYFYLIIGEHILNVPYIDDYDLLQSIFQLTSNGSVLAKIKVLFSQINQHRFGYERIVMWLILVISGSENIKIQIIIGNAFLLGILYLFFKIFQKEKISWYFLIPVNFILFNLVYYENANWGIAAIQNTSLIFFAFLSAYSLGSARKNAWYWGIVAAILATFTSGSGLLTWIIGLVILIIQKKYQRLVVWLGTACAVILFYFLFDYQFVGSSGQSPLTHPIYNLSFLLAFWGNVLYLDKPHPNVSGNYYDIAACIALGIFIGFIFCGWLLRLFSINKLRKTEYFLLGVFMFAMGTGAMLVMSRPIDFYITVGGELLSRRYMIFGVLLVIAAYSCVVIFVKDHEKPKILIGISTMIFAIALNFTSYFMSVSQLRKQHEQLALDGFYWKNHKMLLSFGDHYGDKLFWNHPTLMKKMMIDLQSSGIYRYPATNYPEVATDTLSGINGKFEKQSEIKTGWGGVRSPYIRLKYSSLEPGFKAAYFQLKSKKNTFLFPAVPVASNFGTFLKNRNYYGPSYEYSFFASKILSGKYDVQIIGFDPQKPENGWKSAPSGQQISL